MAKLPITFIFSKTYNAYISQWSFLSQNTVNQACWSNAKWTLSSHQNVTCSRHDLAEEMLTWR